MTKKLFSFIKPDPTFRNNLMGFGWECGSGWYPLIEKLFEDISFLLETKYPEFKDEFEVLQVKEKYATLRVYVNDAPQEIYDLIDKAEKESAITCENCGKEGKEYYICGWYSTLCSTCAEERIAKNI